MAKPIPLQGLIHGLALARKNFPTFVETFNWVTRAVANLAGDFDTSPETGLITVDKTNENAPVIRIRQDLIKERLGIETDKGCFYVALLNASGVTFGNPFYQTSGKTHELSSAAISFSGKYVVGLEIDATSASRTASLKTYASVEALMSAQTDTSKLVIPLYRFAVDSSAGTATVACDFRRTPTAVMWEG